MSKKKRGKIFYYAIMLVLIAVFLVSLSTCEYTLDNGRLVVVAKRID